MAQKHYKALAQLLSLAHDEASEGKHAVLVVDALVSRLCRVLAQDNAHFDSARFRGAVYSKESAHVHPSA